MSVGPGRIAYDVVGDGPLVICVHGMGDSRAAFRHLTPRLVAAGYRVATVDVRGHGESSVDWASYAEAEVAGDLIALARHLGGPAILVGSSSSAAAVPIAAARAPELVSGAVLISPFVGNPKLSLLLRLAQGAVTHSPLLWGMYYTTLYPGAKPADFAEHRAAMRATLRQPGRMAAMRGVVAPGPVRWSEQVGGLRCPVLIVMGDKDPDFPDPESEARQAQALLAPVAASVAVRMIENSGHYPYADAPEPTAVAIASFAAEVGRA